MAVEYTHFGRPYIVVTVTEAAPELIKMQILSMKAMFTSNLDYLRGNFQTAKLQTSHDELPCMLDYCTDI